MSMIDAATQSYSVPDLLREAVGTYNANNQAAIEFGSQHQPVIDAYVAQEEEFHACAKELANRIIPYSFSKFKRNFTDKGYEDFHNGREANIAAGGILRIPYTEVGSVDYLAAAQVDKKFMDLCKQRMAAVDFISRTNNSRYFDQKVVILNSASEDENDLSTAAPVFKVWPTDFIHGMPRWLLTGRGTLSSCGANFRLRVQLDRRYNEIMNDPTKAAAVSAVRDLYYQEYKQLTSGEELNTAKSVLKNDPARESDGLLQKAEKIAYVNWLGYDKIEAGEEGPAKAVDGLVKASTYSDGRLAPDYETARVSSEIEKILGAYGAQKAVEEVGVMVDEHKKISPVRKQFYITNFMSRVVSTIEKTLG